MRLGTTFAAATVSVAAALFVGASGASAATPDPVHPDSCTYTVTGSPGSESFTAHITNTCDSLMTRAIIGYENFDGTFLHGSGGWVHSGSSTAPTSSNITDMLVCWGPWAAGPAAPRRRCRRRRCR